MKWVLNANNKYKLPYFLSNIFLIFFDSIGFIIPIILGFMLDSVVINNDYHRLISLSVFLVIFIFGKYLGAYLCVHTLDMTSFKITSEIKEKCYHNINNLDHYFFLNNNKGELMTNFTSDINRIRKHISYDYKTIGAILVTFICSLFYLLTINVGFTIILLTPGLIIGFISLYFTRKLKPRYEKLRDLMSGSNEYVRDNIEGNRVVKSFALEHFETKNFKKINKKFIDEDIEVYLMENKFYALIDFFSNLSSVIFLLGGGYLFIKGSISLGSLVIFNSYLYNLRAPFTRLSELLNNIQRYLIANERITKILNAKPHIKLEGTKPIKSLLTTIEFKNVSIAYDNHMVLENLSFTLKPYETIAFIGKTGSGKSSIANILLGFIVPNKGEILINGINYLEYDMKDIREHIGYVTQNAFLFSDTIYNNISYGTNIDLEEALRCADMACCDYIKKLPEGLDTIIGEKGVGLSGGEKQRLCLARALAVKPDILLLDDITSALDIETEEHINKNIKNLNYQATKIIIASKIVSVKDADQIFVLDKGKVVEHGTHQELLSLKGAYFELYNLTREGAK